MNPADLLLLAADAWWRSGPDLAERSWDWGTGICPSNVSRYLGTLTAEGLLERTDPALARAGGAAVAPCHARCQQVYRLTPAGLSARTRLEDAYAHAAD